MLATAIPSAAVYLLVAFRAERMLEEHKEDGRDHWRRVRERVQELEERSPAPGPVEGARIAPDRPAPPAPGASLDPNVGPAEIRGDERRYLFAPFGFLAYRGPSAADPDAVVFGLPTDPSGGMAPRVEAFRGAIEAGAVECRPAPAEVSTAGGAHQGGTVPGAEE